MSLGDALTLAVKVVPDTDGFGRDLGNSVDRESRGIMGSLGKIGGAATKGGAAIGVAIGAGIVAFGPDVLEAGASLDALATKSSTVFEGSLGDVKNWASANAGAMGLTEAAATGTAAGIADLLKPMGFTAEAAAGMSTGMLDAAGALSAWTGGQKSATEVADIMASAMLGETDGLKALGIAIGASDVEARLAAKGQGELTGAAREQAEAIAIQEMIMEKSTDAQKAWADGSMDGIKAQNEAKASIGGLKDTIIQALYPALQGLLPHVQAAAAWLGEHLPGAMEAVKGFVERVWPTIQGIIGNVFTWLQTVAWPIAQTVFDSIVTAIQTTVTFIAENWPKVQAAIGAVIDWFQTVAWPIIEQVIGWINTQFQNLVTWVTENWDEIKATIDTAINAVKTVVETVIGAIAAAWELWGDNLLAYVGAIWDQIKAVIDGAVNAVKGIIETVMALIRGDWEGVWNGLKEIVSGAWTAISGFVSGGIDSIKAVIGGAAEGVKAAFAVVWDGIKGAAKEAWDAIVDGVIALPGRLILFVGALLNAGKSLGGAILDGIVDGVKAVGNFAADVAGAILGAFKDGWNRVADTINNFIPNEVGFGTPFGFVGVDLPDAPIPKFHGGGMIPGFPGEELLIVARGGERVLSPQEARDYNAGGSSGVPGEAWFVVEGTPFRAILAERDLALAGQLAAGVRA